nr:hypothetical protein HAGR004_03140 [Bdellovibrio sp. HAGR004]
MLGVGVDDAGDDEPPESPPLRQPLNEITLMTVIAIKVAFFKKIFILIHSCIYDSYRQVANKTKEILEALVVSNF